MDLTQLVLDYYSWLNGLTSSLLPAIRGLADDINLPLVSVLLFGVMGALAPCQISSSVAALAFVNGGSEPSVRMWPRMLAFIGGKLAVYLLAGGVIVLLGLRISDISATAIPIAVFARRAIGPMLVVVGLVLLGVVRTRFSVGARFSAWLEAKAGNRQGTVPSFLLGAAFSFAFCPTLFMLFFGLTIPLAISSPGGVVFPGVFALGTMLPLVAVAGVLATTRVSSASIIAHIKGVNRWFQHLASVILILVGLHETVLYWLL
jgi:cytochrome c biogenesis protein CcdA